MLFRNRVEAGVRLAGALKALRDEPSIVLGIPCGGMVVAAQVAEALRAPLGVLLVRGDPAARPDGGPSGSVLGESELAAARIACALRLLAERQPAGLAKRVKAALPRAITGPVPGATVVLVDDLVVTGQRARAACEILRWRGAKRVVVAAPVMARGTALALAEVAADVVCLHEVPPRPSLRDAFRESAPVSEGEVVALLARAAAPDRAGEAGGPGPWDEDWMGPAAGGERRAHRAG